MTDEEFKMNEIKCDIGSKLEKSCRNPKDIKRLNDLDTDVREILLWRSKLSELKNDNLTICDYHLEYFGRIFKRNENGKCWVRNPSFVWLLRQ